MDIDITVSERKTLLFLLNAFLPDTTVWAYGSRVKFTSKPESDLDLVAFIKPGQESQLAELKDAFAESDLPFKVDILVWDMLPENFKQNIQRDYTIFQKGGVKKGKIPPNWKAGRLGEVIELKRGYDLPDYNRVDGVIPIYTSSGLTSWHNESKVKGPGVITGRYGTLGEMYYSESDFWPHNTTLYVRDFYGNDPKFIYYFLKTLRFSNSNDKSSVPGLNRNDLHGISVVVPDVTSQKSIASFLSALDDKIKLNLQLNQTLENIAQTIFKEWFVNFNFPGFDGELMDGLPRGWRMGNILEIATLLSGGTPRTEVDEYWHGNIKWISAKDITENNKRFIIKTEKQITELGIESSAVKVLPAFTTVVSARGTVGNYCLLSERMTISQSNYGLKATGDFDFFLFVFVANMIQMMQAFSYGTVFDTITTKTFKEIEITIPPEKVVFDYEQTIRPVFMKILENQEQIQTLADFRDSILPRLMTGKIPVTS